MSLKTLISTVEKTFSESEVLTLLDICENEENFKDKWLISRSLYTTEQIEYFLKSLEDLMLIHVNYQCECGDNFFDIYNSLLDPCENCSLNLNKNKNHLITKLYTIKEKIIEEKEKMEIEEIFSVIDERFYGNFLTLKENLDNVVPFVGSGFSIPLGLPNWTGLINNIGKGLPDQSTKDLFNKYLRNGDVFNALEVLINNSLQVGSEELVKNSIRQYIRKNLNSTVPNEKHNINDILNLNSDFYVTTNYDNALSVYGEKHKEAFVFDEMKDTSDLLRNQEKAIIHMHGIYSRPETMVVSKKDYEKIYIKEASMSKLSAIMASKSFLFVGFSFNDEYFNEIYNKIRNHVNNYHYIILDDLHPYEASKLLEKGLMPISLNLKNYTPSDDTVNKHVSAYKIIFKHLLY